MLKTNARIRFTNASINIVTDICTGVLPLPTLNTLNMPRRQKYALMGVFALGGWYVAQDFSLDFGVANSIQYLHYLHSTPAIALRCFGVA
jgi:hypothetical protein